MKGYKMLNADMTTMYGSMTYEVGKTYKLEGKIIPCEQGFHFCEELTDCLRFYGNINTDKRFFEIEAGDNIAKCNDKYVTDKIILIRELSLDEVLQYIRENKNKVKWDVVSKYQKLSEDFIREFQDKVDWDSISTDQKLSEDFIREFKDKIDWDYISSCQKLSEDFIREFADRVDWYYISNYQKLSEELIREFKDELNWTAKLSIEDMCKDAWSWELNRKRLLQSNI